MNFIQVLMATNSAAQLCIQNTDSILLYTVTIWGGGEETLPKICKLYLYLMYRFFYMNWFWKANRVSGDVLPKCLYLINTNKISFV